MASSDLIKPNGDRYFEDYVPGSVSEYGPISVLSSEVSDFKQLFGPGSWRVRRDTQNGASPDATASEWHVVGLMMRLFVLHFLPKTTSIASPGVEEIRWLEPVRAGDDLRIHITVLEARRSRSKPDRGLVRVFVQTFNQRGELVLTLRSMNLIRCREIPHT